MLGSTFTKTEADRVATPRVTQAANRTRFGMRAAALAGLFTTNKVSAIVLVDEVWGPLSVAYTTSG